MGEVEVHALRGVDFDSPRRRARRAARRVGQRQVDAAQHPRRARRADRAAASSTATHDLTRRRRGRRSRATAASTSASSSSSTTSSRASPRARTSRSSPTSPTTRSTPAEALALVGLGERLDHFPAQLSGGEQQRVAIARAVAKRPDVLLCDEPTGALDFQTGMLVLEVIERVNRELGTTTAVITHNAPIAAMADRVVTLADGRDRRIERATRRKAPPAEISLVSALDRKLLRDLVPAAGPGGHDRARRRVRHRRVRHAAQRATARSRARATPTTSAQRFADVFAHARARARVRRSRALERARRASRWRTTRIVARRDARRSPDSPSRATGRLVSLPDAASSAARPALLLRDGAHARARRAPTRSCVLEAFADGARDSRSGDALPVVLEGHARDLRVVGIALSPEYVFAIGAGAISRPTRRASACSGCAGAPLAPRLRHGGRVQRRRRRARSPARRVPAVLDAVERVLAPYGGLGASPRDKLVAELRARRRARAAPWLGDRRCRRSSSASPRSSSTSCSRASCTCSARRSRRSRRFGYSRPRDRAPLPRSSSR